MVRIQCCDQLKSYHFWYAHRNRRNRPPKRGIYRKTVVHLLRLRKEDFSRRKITFTQIQQRRIIALKYWIKDRSRIEEEAISEHGNTRQVFIKVIDDAYKHKENHTRQKNPGESLITIAFQVKLETVTQQDFWIIDLESNLKIIIVSNGIELS